MTLYDLVVIGGLFTSTTLLAILAALWPASARKDHVLCLKEAIDEECTPCCLRTCHLAA